MERDFYEKLIGAVKSHEVLYNKWNNIYFNKTERQKAWEEIAKITKRSAATCQKRWKLLREKYVKEQKRSKNPYATDIFKPYVEWEFLQKMEFLNEYITPKRRKRNSAFKIDHVEKDGSNFEASDSVTMEEDVSVSNFETAQGTNSASAFESFFNKFDDIFEKFNKKIERDATSLAQEDLDELFAKTITTLLKDLPSESKDTARAEIFNIVVDYRKFSTSI